MLKAWRNEGVCVLAIGSIVALVGLAIGQVWVPLVIAATVYFLWHLFNLILLQRWVTRRRSFRLPVSFGVWEQVFDGLQRLQLLNRKRKQRLSQTLSDVWEAAAFLPDAVVVLDQNNRIEGLNHSAERLLGLRRRANVGESITDLIDHPVLHDNLESGEAGPSVQVPSPVNGAWMLNVHTTAAFGDGRRRLLVAQNITPVYRLEQARRHFIADVSHELRTPVTVFRGYLEALRDAASDNPLWGRPIEQMDLQASRMQNLVEDLLTLSQLEMADASVSEEIVPMAQMLAEICEEGRALSGEQGHKISLHADPSLGLRGDERELRSLASNLIINAVRHTPAGSGIEVRWEAEATNATLTVRDQGEGIAAHHLPRLTDRFYRVDPSRSRSSGGTGLGLAIVKRILDRYDADLHIDSQLGRGTTFRCRFPEEIAQVIESGVGKRPPDAPTGIEETTGLATAQTI